jgi:predicted DNA-binding ribbon-helix-helix protein
MAVSRKKWGRGGARPGAGRKRIVHDPVRLAIDHERADVEALEEIAERRGVSVASLIRKAVQAYVQRHGRK